MNKHFQRRYIFVILVLQFSLSAGWDEVFKLEPCYEKRADERMPLSIDNMIAIIEGYERDDPNTAPEDVADALLYRYRTNGIIYSPEGRSPWTIKQGYEVDKQDLDDKLLKPSYIVPEDTFTPREECSIHMMLSHSIDNYPHAGVDYVWEQNYNRKKRSSYQRSYQSYQNGYDSSKSSYGSYSSSKDYEPAEHPIEFGVIQTSAGPVAAGLLFAGIMSWDVTSSYTVSELVGSDTAKAYMPSEMMSKKVEPLLGTTISGEIAEAAVVLAEEKEDTFEVGPIGMFGNCSSCARIYSLEKSTIPYISRAEVFGALDGLIIAKTLSQLSSSNSVKLSEILRMYYGDHGLFNSDIKACNRKNIFNRFQDSIKDDIREQALNYAYAFQDNYAVLSRYVQVNQDDFDLIESQFLDYIDPILDEVTSFIYSYSYDDPGYEQCPSFSGDEVQTETQVDLVVVYSPTGSTDDIEEQAEYIALTARKLGVGYHRSRIAVLNGMTEKWLAPMTNFSNIADYACNYTTFMNYASGSSQDFIEIIEKLTQLYAEYYDYIRSDKDRTGHNSQVVLWNLPSSFDGNEDEMVRAWNTFNWTYPDITFIFAGTKDSQLSTIFNDDNDNTDDLIFISTVSDDPDEISDLLVEQIRKAPRMFVYPACDTRIDEYESYNEDNHVYTLYVSPNFTTYVQIPPLNFMFSEELTLKFEDSDVKVCVSRINKEPSEDDDEDETVCQDAPFDYSDEYLCDRYVLECSPIYISVRGKSDSNPTCSDDLCNYPNQIEMEFTHDGMTCGVGLNLPQNIFLSLCFVFFYLFHQNI